MHFERALGKEQVAFFYCDSKKDERNATTSSTVLKSLLRQLSWSTKSQKIEAPIQEKFKNTKSHSDNAIDDEDAKTFLIQIIAKCRRTTIIIDAHDECKDREQLVTDLHKIAHDGTQNSPNRVNIFITSRELFFAPPDFSTTLSCAITASSVSEDIKKYVEEELKRPGRTLLYGKHPEIESRIVDVLVRKAHST